MKVFHFVMGKNEDCFLHVPRTSTKTQFLVDLRKVTVWCFHSALTWFCCSDKRRQWRLRLVCQFLIELFSWLIAICGLATFTQLGQYQSLIYFHCAEKRYTCFTFSSFFAFGRSAKVLQKICNENRSCAQWMNFNFCRVFAIPWPECNWPSLIFISSEFVIVLCGKPMIHDDENDRKNAEGFHFHTQIFRLWNDIRSTFFHFCSSLVLDNKMWKGWMEKSTKKKIESTGSLDIYRRTLATITNRKISKLRWNVEMNKSFDCIGSGWHRKTVCSWPKISLIEIDIISLSFLSLCSSLFRSCLCLIWKMYKWNSLLFSCRNAIYFSHIVRA